MLSAASRAVVQATLPVVGDHLDAITGVFYETMLGENPDLLNLFSRSAQATGAQRQALASAVAAFAGHLLGAGFPIEPVVERIAHRHCALGVRPEQYMLVGRYLLGAVGTVLGEAVTPAVAAAWDEVYWLFAVRLIGREARLYGESGVTAEHPWRTHEVASKILEADDTVSLLLTPADGQPAAPFQPGQYVTVAADLPGNIRQLRQYSLSQAPGGGALRITIRRVHGGAVSGFLHDQVEIGDQLQLSQPYGNLTLDAGDGPLLLVSAGVGITPMASILDQVARTQPARAVTAVHADRSAGRHPLRADIAASGARLRSFTHQVWYEDESGLIDPAEIPLHPDAGVYLCGPIPFMRQVRAGLHRRGIPEERIRYEVFGSEQWNTVPAAAPA